MSLELLSRIQFGFTIAFHILYPAFSIGLVTFLAIMEGMWLKTKNPTYLRVCKFWLKIFALTFGMGIVSGIVMEFQLGTNWSGFSYEVGPVLGSLFTYEVMTAFFIEAGFLGIMIFGWERVSPRLHFISTLTVVFGVTLSAFWIMSANSWMQTPTGAILKDGIFEPQNWFEIIFNPLLVPRFLHMLLSAYITTAFAIAAVCAYYLLQGKHEAFSKTCLSFVITALVIFMPIQIGIGDWVGVNVHDYQPIKSAAMEGVWNTTKGAPLLLFAIPDQKAEKNHYEIGIPYLASLINTHEWNGELQGLKTVPPQDRPHVGIVFWTFRIMVGLGFLMLFYAIWGFALKLRGTLYSNRLFLTISQYMVPTGFAAMILGWVTAEVGRQPWIVQGMVRTNDVVSKITLENVLISMGLIVIVYGLIFGIFYFRYLGKVLEDGPKEHPTIEKLPFAYMEEHLQETQ